MSMFAKTPAPEYAPDLRRADTTIGDRIRRQDIGAEIGDRIDIGRDLGAQQLIRRVNSQRATLGRGDREALLDVAAFCQSLVERMDRSDAGE